MYHIQDRKCPRVKNHFTLRSTQILINEWSLVLHTNKKRGGIGFHQHSSVLFSISALLHVVGGKMKQNVITEHLLISKRTTCHLAEQYRSGKQSAVQVH